FSLPRRNSVQTEGRGGATMKETGTAQAERVSRPPRSQGHRGRAWRTYEERLAAYRDGRMPENVSQTHLGQVRDIRALPALRAVRPLQRRIFPDETAQLTDGVRVEDGAQDIHMPGSDAGLCTITGTHGDTP
ncbi:MAG: hypothetical protein AAF311_04570, partial [Pseudomonadota bacterium]